MPKNVMNEEYVLGLVKAMTAKEEQVGEGMPTVKMRYMGDMYTRGPIFRVEGTSIEGTPNEICEASERAGVVMEILKRKECPVVAAATAPKKKHQAVEADHIK